MNSLFGRLTDFDRGHYVTKPAQKVNFTYNHIEGKITQI